MMEVESIVEPESWNSSDGHIFKRIFHGRKAGKEVRCRRMKEKHSRNTFAIKPTGRLFLLAILILGLQAVMKSCGAAVTGGIENQGTLGEAMLNSLADGAETALYSQFMPGMAFLSDGGYRRDWLLRMEMDCLVPFYAFLSRQIDGGDAGVKMVMAEMIFQVMWNGMRDMREDTKWKTSL